MSNLIARIALVALFVAASFGVSFAKDLSAYPYHEVESWQNEGMTFVVRDSDGHIVAHAKGHLERWVSETQMVWVVRDEQGKFMTFARGVIETWKNGSKHLVLRNKDGKFIAVGKVSAYTGPLSHCSEQDALNVIAVF